MGGPWFTVLDESDAWRPMSTLWLSDGRESAKAALEVRVRLAPAAPE